MRRIMFCILAAGILLEAGCQTSHEVEIKPVEVKPIHITIDVNVRVDRALDDFFSDVDQVAEEVKEDKGLGEAGQGGAK
ncbi:MAG: YnbE family lipoprotein [Desulfatibacillaceae bacterium]